MFFYCNGDYTKIKFFMSQRVLTIPSSSFGSPMDFPVGSIKYDERLYGEKCFLVLIYTTYTYKKFFRKNSIMFLYFEDSSVGLFTKCSKLLYTFALDRFWSAYLIGPGFYLAYSKKSYTPIL